MNCLYIIAPAYNEAANISDFVNQWYPLIEHFGNQDSRLVVINDGSRDETLIKLNRLKENHEKLIVMDKPNEGHGPTLIRGYRYAISSGADYIFQTDSDGQTNPDEFESFWKLRHEYDGVFGYRKVRGDGKMRKFVESVLVILLRIVFGVKVKDANAPFRLLNASVLNKYIARLTDDFNLPNVMITTYFAYYRENMIFKEITFQARSKGKNSINLKRIASIGIQAVKDFKILKKKM